MKYLLDIKGIEGKVFSLMEKYGFNYHQKYTADLMYFEYGSYNVLNIHLNKKTLCGNTGNINDYADIGDAIIGFETLKKLLKKYNKYGL